MESVSLSDNQMINESSTPDLRSKCEITKLESITNFSRTEIASLYEYYGSMSTVLENGVECICRYEIEELLDDAELTQPLLRKSLWKFICGGDSSKASVARFDIVKALNAIQRGTMTDIASMFFTLYDINGEGQLSAEGVTKFYSDMLCRDYERWRQSRRGNKRRGLNRNSMSLAQSMTASFRVNSTRSLSMKASVLTKGMSGHFSGSKKAIMSVTSQHDKLVRLRPSLSTTEHNNIINWVETVKADNSGTLDKAAFVSSMINAGSTTPTLNIFGKRTYYYLFFLTFFELGGTFATLSLALLPDQFKREFDITESEIGVLNSVFFVAGIISPPVGGALFDVLGPTLLNFSASIVVTIGAAIQWLSLLTSNFIVLIVARFLIGFGLEICFLTTIEIYMKIFPHHFGFMIGMHSLRGALIYFIASVVLREVSGTLGIKYALALAIFLCIVTTIASFVVDRSLKREESIKSKREGGSINFDTEKIISMFASLANILTPKAPKGRSKWILPVSFYFSIIGNKAINFFLNTFSVFAVEVYVRNFHATHNMAAFAMGVTALVGGVLAMLCGFLMDKYGRRSLLLCAATSVGMVAFFVMQCFKKAGFMWVTCLCFAITLSCADLGIVSIPLLVSRSQVGMAYGVYGLVGNSIDAALSASSGWLIEWKEYIYIWICTVFMLFGSVSWLFVYFLEKDRSFIEKPTNRIIDTSEEDICLASLVDIVKPSSENIDDKLEKSFPSTRLNEAGSCELREEDEEEE